MMQASLITTNIVFVGLFNISLFDKYFFIKNKIFDEEDILSESRFDTVNGIQLITNVLDVIIVQNQIIISSKIIEPNSNVGNEEINKIALSIIERGKVLNISAFGINFNWSIEDTSMSLQDLSKSLFYSDNISLLNNFFNNQDSVFGIYASTKFKNARLKLDVKPSNAHQIINNTVISKEVIIFGFNFHFDVKDLLQNTEVLNYLNDYSDYKKESKRIISIYE